MNNILNYFYDNNEYNENFNCEDINRPFEDYLNYDQLLAYYRYERDQRVINTAIHDAKNEGINEGINKGINIGIKKAKLEDAKTLISNIYHIDDFEWLDNCTLEQLDKVITFVTQSYTYQELKKEILK